MLCIDRRNVYLATVTEGMFFAHMQDVFLEKTVIAAVKHVGGDVEVWCYVSALRSGQLGVTDLNVNSASL